MSDEVFAGSGDDNSTILESVLEGANQTLNNETSAALNWASDWFGYIALCMFSMVLLVPTMGIVCLMVWEYFSDETERRNERQKEIENCVSTMSFENLVKFSSF